MFRGYLPRNKIPYNFQPLSGFGAGGGLPIANKIFDLRQVTDDKIIDFTGQFVAPDGHDYRNAHLIGDGVTAIYFYAGLDGETVYLYNIGTSSWVSQVYTHATGIVLGAGVEILEAYSDLGDVWTFEEKGCAALYNSKGTDHGYIDATGTALENFRSGRNFLSSQWKTSIRYKNNNAYGYSGSVGVTGATTGYRFTEPVPVDVDFTMTYGPLTSPIIYDYANTESDGSGDGYGFRINTDYTADFYRKDAGVITVLASATAGDYEGGIRVVMNYNIANDKFTLKAYELGSVNPSDTDNVIDPTHAYPENDYQRFEFPNGNETIELITDGTVEDLGLWTITGTVCVAYVPSAFTFDGSLPPIITGFIYDDVGNRLDALGGRLEFVGTAKFNADFVNSNCIDFSTTGPTLDFATPLAGGETLEYQGTATLALSTTQITISAIGTVYDIKIYDGETLIHHYAVAEGGEDTLYDLVGGNKITLNLFNLDDWSEQDEYHYNMVNGFDAYENTLGERLFVPIGSTVTQAGYELLDTFVQDGKSLLPCETDIVFLQAPALVQADTNNVLFDVAGTPLEIDWFDVLNATAEQEVIGIEPTVGNDGQGQVIVEGLTVQNVFKNNDIQDASGFVPQFSTISASGNRLSITGDGTQAFPRVYTELDAPSAKWFVYAKAKVDNSVAIDIRTRAFASSVFADIVRVNAPNQDEFYELFEIYNGVLERLYIQHDYADAATANGKVMEVDGRISEGGGVFAVKLEGNIADITKEQALFMVHAMQAGTDLQHLKNPILRATGKNLFDLNSANPFAGFFDSSGNLQASPGNTSDLNYTKVYGNLQLTLDTGTLFKLGRIVEYDKNENVINVILADAISYTFTTTPSTRFIRFHVQTDSFDFASTQLEPGTIATAYEPFKSSEMTILSSGGADWIGRSLLNGVSDLSYTYFGKNVQNVQEYVLQASDFESLITSPTNVDYVNFKKPLDYDGFGIGDFTAINGRMISNFSIGDTVFADDALLIGNLATTNDDLIGIIVANGEFANESEAQAFLTGKVINYQLATPIITDAEITIVDENSASQDYWHLYENGQISGEAEDLLPIIQYKNLQHGDQIMADTSRGDKKQRLVGYAVAQIGYALQQIYRALNK